MEIWEEIAADADAGAERLVAEFGDRLFTAACAMVQCEAEAEDLVLRTFERTISKISQYDGRCQFFSWLYSILLNFRRIDLRRKGANALVFDGEIPETEDPAPDPAETLSLRNDAAAVRAAIAHLPETLRAVIVLHYFEDFSLAEIAELTDAPIGTVKFRMHHARKTLAATLSQTFHDKTASN